MQQVVIKKVAIEAAVMASVFRATAVPDGVTPNGATIIQTCNKLAEVIELDAVKSWTNGTPFMHNINIRKSIGHYYSEPFDQFMTSFISQKMATMGEDSNFIKLNAIGRDECEKIIRSFMREGNNEDVMQPILDHLGLSINPAPAILMKQQDIYKGLSNGRVMVFMEYTEPASDKMARRIYYDLELGECENVDYQEESALAMLPFAEFLAIAFVTEEEAQERVNAIALDPRKWYKAFLYVNGECTHESV